MYNYKIENISILEMNKLLNKDKLIDNIIIPKDKCKENIELTNIFDIDDNLYQNLKTHKYNIIVDDKLKFYFFTVEKNKKNIYEEHRYITYKDGRQIFKYTNGGRAYNQLLRLSDKFPNITTEYVKPVSTSPYLYNNPKYIGKEIEAPYHYDMNSAYPYGMLQDMPDTSKKYKSGKVKNNEIGFELNGDLVEVGNYAPYIFPKIKSPFINFANKIYELKRKAKDNYYLKQYYKNTLNYAIGTLQNHNCFLRAAIVGYIVNYINSLKDDYTIKCNTDSIVSEIERPDLPISDKIGDFKLESRESLLIHKKSGNFTKGGIDHIRGQAHITYIYNKKKNQLERINNEF